MTELLAQIVLFIGGSAELLILAKATAILMLALLGVRVWRRAAASVLALVLASTFGVLLVLPIAALVMPPVALQVASAGVTPHIAGSSARISTLRGDNPVVSSTDLTANSQTTRRPVSARLLLATAWTTGCCFFLVPVIETLWRLRRLRPGSQRWVNREPLVRSLSREAGLNRHVQLLLQDDLVVPFTYGVVRPAIVMPSDAQQWTDAEVGQAMVHELEHIRRGDWVLHVLARVVCAIYWFHPLIWIAWRRFCLESERACDDAVVRSAEGIAYAEQLVALARRLSRCAAEPMLSMANRGDLAARVTAVLDTTRARGRVGGLTGGATVLVAVVLAAAIAPLKAISGTNTPAPRQTAGQAPARDSFVTATIKPHAAGNPRHSLTPIVDGRFSATDFTLKDILMWTNRMLTGQLIGLPPWAYSDRFDLEAQVGSEFSDITEPTHPRIMAMLRALVADRFKLELSRETRQMPMADLVLANRDGKFGPGLQRSAGDCMEPSGKPLKPDDATRWCGFQKIGSGVLIGKKISMEVLGGMLSWWNEVDRVVYDQTGVSGYFDVHLEFASAASPPFDESTKTGAKSAPISPALLIALETQLGLRLVGKQGPVDVLVIRHAEKPTEK